MPQLISLQPVTRASDSRRFYLVEFGGTREEPAAIGLVDRDETFLCDCCFEAIEPGSDSRAIRGVGTFHPDCAPRL